MAFSFNNLFNIFKKPAPAPTYSPAPVQRWNDSSVQAVNVPSNDPEVIRQGQLPMNPGLVPVKPVAAPAPVASPVRTAPKPVVNTAPPVTNNTTNNTGVLSAEDQALNRQAISEGRFEGMSDAERAKQMRAYLGQKTTANQEIENEYGSLASLLDEIQGRIEGTEGDLITGAGAPFDAQVPLLSQARDEGLRANSEAVQSERGREQNVLTEARVLADELRQANRQRFGGSSSAGEFANDLQGRELQRSTTQIRNTTTGNLRELTRKAEDIRTGYEKQVQSIEFQKQAAVANAKDVYRQRIAAIDNSRFELAQGKAQAKLDALRELRANANNIEATYAQNAEQAKRDAVASAQQLRNAITAYQVESGQQPNLAALPGATFSTQSGFDQSTPGADPLANGSVALTTGRKRPEDELINPLAI